QLGLPARPRPQSDRLLAGLSRRARRQGDEPLTRAVGWVEARRAGIAVALGVARRNPPCGGRGWWGSARKPGHYPFSECGASTHPTTLRAGQALTAARAPWRRRARVRRDRSRRHW